MSTSDGFDSDGSIEAEMVKIVESQMRKSNTGAKSADNGIFKKKYN